MSAVMRPLVFTAMMAIPGMAATLGLAENWNILAFDSINYSNASAGGGFAAGNSMTLGNMSIAQSLPAGNTSLQVLSGGSVGLLNGFINGSIQYATTIDNSASQPPGATVTQAPAPFDFAMAKAMYENYSDSLMALAVNGTTTVAGSTITFEGSNAVTNVFTVNSTGYGATINNLVLRIPAGATAIINVIGSSVDYNYGGFDTTFGGTTAGQILWNLHEATNASTAGTSLQGAVLAPKATLDFQNGSLNGQVIANAVIGTSYGLGYTKFDGNIPGLGLPSPVPEPSTLPLALSALAGILLLRHRRNI